MKTKNFEIVKLFELIFIDNTKVWASVNVVNNISIIDTICFGTFDRGLNLEVLKLLKKDLQMACYFANELSKNKKLVVEYIDFVELGQKRKLAQLTKAF